MEQPAVQLEFGSFRLDPGQRLLVRVTEHGDEPVQLGARALDILLLLLRCPSMLVGKGALIDAVWPGIAVEDNNLTVQMSALRRALGEGQGNKRYIETVPGRGYRFVAPITEVVGSGSEAPQVPPHLPAPLPLPPARRFAVKPSQAVAMLVVVATGLSGTFAAMRPGTPPLPDTRPALSIAVLPFTTGAASADYDYLAEAITDDLAAKTASIDGAFVIAHETAKTVANGETDRRRTAARLGVRYLLEGSVRPFGALTRVNARLVKADSGVVVWSEQIDSNIVGLPVAQDGAVNRIAEALGSRMLDSEAQRVTRERPTNANAMDLVLRARSILNMPQNSERNEKVTSLLRQAVARDPMSVPAMTYLGNTLVLRGVLVGDYSGSGARIAEARRLLALSTSINPRHFGVLSLKANLLRVDGAWEDAAIAYRTAIDAHPNWSAGYSQLALCAIMLGRPAEALPLLETALRLNPLAAEVHTRYALMGKALLSLGRNEEAVGWLRRAAQALPPPWGAYNNFLAAALAAAGHLAEARAELLHYLEQRPCMTVSRMRHLSDPASARALWNAVADGLALAGLRDHAGAEVRTGPLPGQCTRRTVPPPGVRQLTTDELQDMLAARTPAPLLLQQFQTDVVIPGTVQVSPATIRADADAEPAQVEVLRPQLEQLSGGNLDHPVVAVAWNVETAGGQLLAARAASLGYRQVYSYPEGLETWIARQLPVEKQENASRIRP